MAALDTVEFVASLLAAVVLVGEVALAVLALERGGGRAASRFLAAFLLLHAVLFGFSAAIQLFGLWDGAVSHRYYGLLWGTTFAVLPALLLGFAATHPTPLPAVRGRRWLLAAPFAVPALAVPFALRDLGFYGSDVLDLVSVSYLVLGAVAAALLFRARARAARTRLEARRQRYMANVVAVPLAAVAAVLLGFFALFPVVDIEALPGGEALLFLLLVSFLAVVFLPPLALGYGLLRYRILDLDLHARFGVQQGLVGTLFLVVYFVVSEGTQAFFGANEWLGIGAAAVLLVAIVPLERGARRVAGRVVRADDSATYRAFRRWETYRATYEDVSADGITARERRTLDALARTLRLDPSSVRAIEREVAAERSVRPVRRR